MRILIAMLSVLLCYIFAGCKGHSEDVMNDKELKAYVEAHIKPGDSRERIEQFFQNNGWKYEFNQFEPRYEARYELGDVDTQFEKSGAAVLVYVDERGLLKSIEIYRAYTGW